MHHLFVTFSSLVKPNFLVGVFFGWFVIPWDDADGVANPCSVFQLIGPSLLLLDSEKFGATPVVFLENGGKNLVPEFSAARLHVPCDNEVILISPPDILNSCKPPVPPAP